MSTSLAEQLQRLAVPQTSRLQQDKRRASLLFDPKEAASLNKETVYQIGIDGLEELKERNIVFAEFENTLFHITSKDFERSIETAQANQKLDKNIRRFLYLLSPHFMFNCSYKALEWLVYRYYIHEYNKEDLLMLILPYHETNIFVRTLQLLNLKNSNDKWHWLKPLQKTGVHLTKQVLYNNLAANAHFLECIANYVLSIVKEHENPSCLTIVYNFYCSSFAGALEYTGNVNELQISQMLPVLLEGLSSTVPDFAASSYVICAQLLSKIQLSSKILDTFTSKISQMQVPKLKNEAVLVLLVLYQTQKNHTSMENIKILNSQPGLVKVIEKYSREGMHIEPLMISILKSSIKEILVNNDDRCKLFIDEILNEVKFDNSFIDPFIRSLLEICSQHIKSANETNSWVKDLLCKIERQYPAAFDKAIKDIMKPTKKPTLIQKTICKILGDVGNIDSMYDLMEKLYNPNSDTRMESVKLLRKKFDVFRERDCEAIENAILDRIKDDCVEVSYKTLREFRPKFAVLNLGRLKNVLLEILNRCQNDRNWLEVLPITLELLCQYYDESDVHIFLTTLPFLLPISGDELSTACLVLKSTYATRSKLLSPVLDDLANVSASEFSAIVCKSLCENEQLFDINLLAKTLKEMPEKSTNALYKYMALLMMCSALPSTTDFGVACLVLDIIEIYMSEHVISQSEPIISSYILLARKNKLSLQCLLDCLQNLITKISIDNVSFNCHDFNQNDDISDFIIRLLKILIRGTSNKKQTQSKAYKTILGVFLKRFCSNDVIFISEFLLNLLISNNPLIDDQFRFSCALLVKSIINKNVKLPSKSFVIPYLLVGFTMHNAVLRREFADILTSYNTSLKPAHVAHSFLVQFCEHLETVVMDHEGSAQVMQTICTTKTDAFVCRLIELLDGNYQLYFKAGILTLLHKAADFDTYNKTSEPAIEILKNNKDTFNIPESKIIEVNIGYLNHHLAKHVNENSTVWSFITLCIRNDKSTFQLADGKRTCPSAQLLEGIDREVFLHLNETVKKLLLNEIVEVATITENAEVSQAASHALKRIELDSSLILERLQNMRDVRSPSANPQKVKRRVNIVPTADILETISWRRGVTILEFIQDKKKIRKTSLLLSTLFEILKKCLDFEEQANVEYPKQLLLSTILHCCQKSDNRIPEGAFDMQLVVQCIRASQNPQTHHHALLLLAEIASIIPKQVLHHIIAIFTFMGSSVLRHDDEYSFQIITKIIDTVTPILIEDGKTESVAQVLRVFVDAILDIPEHRHMRLFKQLLTRIDAKENLHLFLLIVFEAQVVHGQVEKQKTNNKSLTNSEAPKRLDIAADLCREFSPEIVIITCIKILQYLCKLPEEKNDAQNINNYTFDIQRYTPKQFRHYKYIIILFVFTLLSSKQFVTQVATLSDTEMQQLENLFKEAIIVILKYTQATAKSVESNINTPQSQYWRVMLHYSCDTLDALNSLLTEKMFLLVIRGLMVYSLSTIRKRALDLLNNKLQDKTDFMNECDKEELYNVIVTPLVNIIKTIEEPDIDYDQEQVVQKAFVSLKLLVRNIGADDPEKFKQILDFTAELVQTGRGTINDNVLASAILCVAELCNELRAHAISSLHKCMPAMLKILKPNKDAIPSLLLTSNVAAINKILDSLSLFLSPFLVKLLCGVSVLAAKWSTQSNDQKLTAFTTKIQSVQLKLGQLVPLRVLLPAVQQSYTVLVNKGNFSAIEPLMKVLCESLNTLKGNDIHGHLADLTNFFLQALQFRTDSECENVEQIEENIIKAIGSLVLKLSETTFRPLYYKIFDWAVRTDVKTERIITFYNLSQVFANCLKGLFSLFAGHFLNNAAKLLDDCNQIKNENLHFEHSSKNAALIENILKTLHTIFMYDSQKFVNKERFEVLMQPIVDQLENTLGGLDDLETRANEILIPCIVQFAVATADDSLWKQMNYQILLKTRHNTSKIRLIALNAVGETAKKLGEDFLPLLPETIPFLAELLEDEDETVEKSCQKMLQELEKVLGEPLQKYF